MKDSQGVAEGSFTRPTLWLHPTGWEYLKCWCGGAAESLERYFSAPSEEASSDDRALAETIAAALEDVCYTSTLDAPYFACVITGVDLEDDEAFFGGVGIARDERASCGGSIGPKLATFYGPLDGEENTPTVCLLTNFEADDADLLDEYFSSDDLPAYSRAAEIIEGIGTVVGGYLCADDNATRIIFTFAKRAATTWVGVLTVEV